MIGLDTNVLVRYLAGDPDTEAQVIQAIHVVDAALNTNTTVFINDVVICETIWVLLYHYHTPKERVIEALEIIIRHPGFAFEGRGSLKRALSLYQQRKGDFADCLIAILNQEQGCTKTLSFDKQAIKGLGFQAP